MSDELDTATKDLIFFDPATPLTEDILDRFDIDPATVKPHTFKDEKSGQDQTYYSGILTFDGLPPYFTIEGESYGVQEKGSFEKNKNKGESSPELNNQGFIKLPSHDSAGQPMNNGAVDTSENGPNSDKKFIPKTKRQISVKLSKEPHPDQWTEEERVIIDFISNGLRKIYAHVLSKRTDILGVVNAKLVENVQETFAHDMQDPEKSQKYSTPELQMAHFAQLIKSAVYSGVTKKVYRKKIKTKPGEKVNVMASQFDVTSHPALYADIMNYVDQNTGKEVFLTKFYEYVEDVPELDWPQMSGEKAIEYGRCFLEAGIRFDDAYFGAAMAPQPKAGEIVLKKKISGGKAHTGRMIRADPSIPRDQRLVKRTAIVSPSDAKNVTIAPPSQSIQTGAAPLAQPQTESQPQSQSLAPQAFDPSGFASLSGAGSAIAPVTITQ